MLRRELRSSQHSVVVMIIVVLSPPPCWKEASFIPSSSTVWIRRSSSVCPPGRRAAATGGWARSSPRRPPPRGRPWTKNVTDHDPVAVHEVHCALCTLHRRNTYGRSRPCPLSSRLPPLAVPVRGPLVDVTERSQNCLQCFLVHLLRSSRNKKRWSPSWREDVKNWPIIERAVMMEFANGARCGGKKFPNFFSSSLSLSLSLSQSLSAWQPTPVLRLQSVTVTWRKRLLGVMQCNGSLFRKESFFVASVMIQSVGSVCWSHSIDIVRITSCMMNNAFSSVWTNEIMNELWLRDRVRSFQKDTVRLSSSWHCRSSRETGRSLMQSEHWDQVKDLPALGHLSLPVHAEWTNTHIWTNLRSSSTVLFPFRHML